MLGIGAVSDPVAVSAPPSMRSQPADIITFD
jgi:hypothetical protein